MRLLVLLCVLTLFVVCSCAEKRGANPTEQTLIVAPRTWYITMDNGFSRSAVSDFSGATIIFNGNSQFTLVASSPALNVTAGVGVPVVVTMKNVGVHQIVCTTCAVNRTLDITITAPPS